MQFRLIGSIGLITSLALSACAGNETMLRAEGFASGTRLHARVLDGGDGARTFLGWQDTQLNESCRYMRTSTDTWHCLPGELAVVNWSDAACSQPVAIDGPLTACSTSRYRIDIGSENRRLFTVGEPIAGATTVFVGTPQDCRSVELGPGLTIRVVTAVDLAPLVSATEHTTVHASNLSSRSLSGADGSRETVELFDPGTNAACAPSGVSDVRCLPLSLTFPSTFLFADATCTERVAPSYFPPGVGGPAIVLDSVACGAADADLYAVGEIVDATMLFRVADGVCVPAPVSGGLAYHRIGARIDRSTFAAVRRDRIGTGRLASLSTSTLDDHHVPARGSFFEDSQHARCTAVEFPDRSLRCVRPSSGTGIGPQGSSYFADAACTRPIVQASTDCSGVAPTYTLVTESVACARFQRVRAFSFGATIAPGSPVYMSSAPGECLPSGSAAAGTFEIGPELPAETFPLVTAVTL